MEKIYLDHASAMPIDPRVLKFAEQYLKGRYGNPSSLHSAGLEAKRTIEDARKKVAELINAEKETCIIFTGGATESNNLAIKGTALRNMGKGKKVTASAIEHISVLNPMKELQKSGFELSLIPVDSTGVDRCRRFRKTQGDADQRYHCNLNNVRKQRNRDNRTY